MTSREEGPGSQENSKESSSPSEGEDDRKPPAREDWIPQQDSSILRQRVQRSQLERAVSEQRRQLGKVKIERRNSRSNRIRGVNHPYGMKKPPRVARRRSSQESISSSRGSPTSIESPMLLRTASREYNAQDEDLQSQQRAILDQIKQENQRQSTLDAELTPTKLIRATPVAVHPRRSTRSSKEDFKPPHSKMASMQEPGNVQDVSPSDSSIPTKILVPQQQTSPRTKRPKHGIVEMYPGTFVHIHGTRKAWDAIAKGQAVVVQCSVCKKRFQISKSARVLYCTNCGSLTPAHIEPHTDADDYAIALRMQKQEFDAEIQRTEDNRSKDKGITKTAATEKEDDDDDEKERFAI